MSVDSFDQDQELHDIQRVMMDVDHFLFNYDDPLLTTPLVSAMLADNMPLMETLIKSGKSVNVPDNHGNTPLHVAVLKTKLRALEHLLTLDELSMDPVNHDDGDTPLLLACKTTSTPPHFIRLLLEKGADTTCRNYLGNTPLLASIPGRKDANVISLLLEHGSRIDHQNWEGHSALHSACLETSAECVGALLYWGADPWVCDKREQLPLDLAIQECARDVVELLLPYYFDCYCTAKIRLASVTWALLHETDIMRDLLGQGAFSVAFGDMDLESFESNLLDLDPELLRLSSEMLREALSYLFRPGRPTLVNMFVHYSHFEPSKVLSNSSQLFSDSHLSPMVVENANIRKMCSAITALMTSPLVGKASPCQVGGLIFLMLSHGVELTAQDLVSVYDQFGYCDLFHDLLFMDVIEVNANVYREVESLLPGIYFNLRHDVEYYMSRGEFFSRFYRNSFNRSLKIRLAREMLGLFADSRLRDFVLRDFDRGDDTDEEEEVLRAIAKERRFPSLLELSRNASREHILEVFGVRTTRQYYTIVENLPVAKLQKDVLLFKSPIYFLN